MNTLDKFHWNDYVQQMLKSPPEVKEVEFRAEEHLRSLLAEVPFIRFENIQRNLHSRQGEIDLYCEIDIDHRRYELVCEVKSIGQPRTVRGAAAQLRHYIEHRGKVAYGILIAPFLSDASKEICREFGIGYLDFEGNCRIVFDRVYIVKTGASKPVAEKRSLRSLFAPKSAQVLKVLMQDPNRAWKVAELAEVSGVSVGHVSNVRTALIAREWAEALSEGVSLSKPGDVLDHWARAYREPGKRQSFYTRLHGRSLQEAIGRASERRRTHIMLGSFSAAQWLAPYARTSSEFLYADTKGFESLREELELSTAERGGNITIAVIDDPGFFRDAINPARHVTCTGFVQTYLDLFSAGERGREAAEHLRREKLQWKQ